MLFFNTGNKNKRYVAVGNKEHIAGDVKKSAQNERIIMKRRRSLYTQAQPLANNERIERCIIKVRDGLKPPCEGLWFKAYGKDWLNRINSRFTFHQKTPSSSDLSFLLQGIIVTWSEIWEHSFGHTERNWVHEMLGVRHRHAHNDTFDIHDTYRAVDTSIRLLDAFGDEVNRERVEWERYDLLHQIGKARRIQKVNRLSGLIRLW